MINCRNHRGRSRAGLTLAELMVAAGILAVITVFSAQIMGDVTRIWTSGKGRSDTYTAARALMTRMRTDIERSLPMPDLPGFVRNPSAAQLEFTTRVMGIVENQSGAGSTTVPRPLSFVRYRLGLAGSDEGGYLLREDRAFQWDEPPFGSSEGSAKTRRLCPNVVGFTHRFVKADGELEKQYTTNQPVVAVLLALAVSDDRAYQRLKLTGDLSKVTESFSSLDPKEWEEALSGQKSSMPPAARQGVRVFQQMVPLPVTAGREE